MRRFHLGDILTITTGIFLTPNGMDGIYDILNYMTGDDLFTHQLPRAMDECRPDLFRQHPDLAQIDPPEFHNKADVRAWLAEMVGQYGAERDVAPLAKGDHTSIDPIAELRMIRPDMPITVIETD